MWLVVIYIHLHRSLFSKRYANFYFSCICIILDSELYWNHFYFNIFLSELCFIVKDVIIASSANDITLSDFAILQKRLYYNYKFYQTNFFSGFQTKWRIINIELGNSLFVRSNCERILWVKTDYKHNFDKLVKTFSSKANSKLRELAKLGRAAKLKSLY